MCGLIGIINKNWENNLAVATESIFKQLLFVGSLRGFDSTGIFKVTKTHTTEIVKKPSAASWFLGNKEAQVLIDNYYKDSFAIFGHNRKATIGLKNEETAHPFKENQITLMHNGTLTSWDHAQGKNLSDSHYICKELANENKEFKPLESFKGAYALVWHNAQKKQINFCRNEERPLWILEAKDWYILVSEREMGEWILLRNGYDVLDATEIEAGYIYKMSWKNKLHITKIKFTPNKQKYNFTESKIPIDFEEDDTEESAFGNYSLQNQQKPSYKNQALNLPTPTIASGTELTIVPYTASKQNFAVGGYSSWAGVGIKEERMEFIGRIHYPLSLAGQKVKWSVPLNEYNYELLDTFCTGIYSYRSGTTNDPWIKVLNVTKKENVTPILLPSTLPTKKEDKEEDEAIKKAIENDTQESQQHLFKGEELIVETYNAFFITENNWEDIASCKCRTCNSPFDIDMAEQSVISEKIINGTIQYTYICHDCLADFQERTDKSNKNRPNIITLETVKQSIKPAN